MTGTRASPARVAARSRRSPAISSSRPAMWRTTTGWRSPRLAASRTPVDRMGGPFVDSRAPNARRRPEGTHLLAGPAESHATERSKTDAAGGPARARPPASPAPVGWAAGASGGGSVHALRPQPPADGHALDPPDEARVHAVHGPRELHLVQPRHEPLEDLLQLEPGEVRAEAEVDADAEAVVLVRGAVDAERERVGEDVLVAVGRRVEDAARLALADPRPPHLHVLDGGAAELDDRAHPADDLLDGRRHQGRVAAQLLELARVLDQREQAPGGGVAGRLVAGDDEQHVVREQLPLGDGLAVHLRVGEGGEDIVAGLTPASPGEPADVLEELLPRPTGR